MIEHIPGRPEGTLEFRVTGKVTAKDYETILGPIIERALVENDRLKLLIVVDEAYEGFDLGAAWEDARLGMKHWSGFARAAVVTDKDWLQTVTKAMAFMMPCPVKAFDLDELDEARRWLSESLGAIHMREMGGTALHVELMGELAPVAYAQADGDLDAFVNRAGGLRLLLDLRGFEGWQGLGGLREHLSLLRDHYQIPDRVAVVMDDAWVKLAQKVLSRFMKAEIRTYDEDDFEAAKAWITQADA
ncbi:STAS/SEC14 domain-containing protein [Tropicimonas sp. S265A]|uniref:STAS/SEC14 domain-containing protein n=1 Tax=Tropicimonas sp. S265A TaxID=3415134 RepID=UPI003C7E87D9